MFVHCNCYFIKCLHTLNQFQVIKTDIIDKPKNAADIHANRHQGLKKYSVNVVV